MIKTYKDRHAEALFNGYPIKGLPTDILRSAQRKLKVLHNATSLNDLKIPPANRLEALKGDRQGQFSIRINSQWRICFTWCEHDAYDVEIVDYH